MGKSGFGSYKKNSASSIGLKSSIDSFASIYAAVLNIAGPDLLFFGFPETTTTVSGKVSKWTSFSNYLTSSSPLFLDQTTAATRPALNSSATRPFEKISNVFGTYLTTRSTAGTYGNVNMTTVTDMTVCTYMDLNNVDGAGTFPILFETGPGASGGAYMNTLGALEIQIVFPTTVAAGKIEFDLKRGHLGQYQIAAYLLDNTNDYLRTGFNHYTFYFKAARDDNTGNTFAMTINNVVQTQTARTFSPVNPALANNVTNFGNLVMSWGASYDFAPISADYSSLIIIGRNLTTDERTKIYNIQRAIADTLQ